MTLQISHYTWHITYYITYIHNEWIHESPCNTDLAPPCAVGSQRPSQYWDEIPRILSDRRDHSALPRCEPTFKHDQKGKHSLWKQVWLNDLPSGKHTKSYWKLLFIVDLPSYKIVDLSIVTLVYQRVNGIHHFFRWNFGCHVEMTQHSTTGLTFFPVLRWNFSIGHPSWDQTLEHHQCVVDFPGYQSQWKYGDVQLPCWL